MPAPPDPEESGRHVTLRQLPWQVRLVLDIVMLRSTPITAVFWCTFLLLMLVHVAWACGFLARYGFDGGFVRVSDQVAAKQEADNKVAGVERRANDRLASVEGKIDWQLKLSITRELRETAVALCKARDSADRAGLQAYIDQLVTEYERLTGKAIAAPPCTALR